VSNMVWPVVASQSSLVARSGPTQTLPILSVTSDRRYAIKKGPVVKRLDVPRHTTSEERSRSLSLSNTVH